MLAGSDFSGQLSTTFHSGVFMQGLIELAVSGGALQEQAGRASLTEATPHYTHTHTHTIIYTNIPPYVRHTPQLQAMSSQTQ